MKNGRLRGREPEEDSRDDLRRLADMFAEKQPERDEYDRTYTSNDIERVIHDVRNDRK